jgi:hypothetical protein
MISQGSKRSPVVEFLGDDAGVGGPFALLGLLHEIESDAQVIRARNRRLHQIDLHRHRSTPDADEVRLAVYTAASQLLDHKLRDELRRRWPQGTPVAIPQAWKPSKTVSRITPVFLQNAKRLIGVSGGWNLIARKRLAYYARMHRVSALELVEALSPKNGKHDDPLVDHAQKTYSSIREFQKTHPVRLIEEPAPNSMHWIGAYALLVLMGGALVTSVIVNPPAFEHPITTRELSEFPQEKNQRSGSELESPSQNNPQRDIQHYTAIAHELDQLVTRARTDYLGSVERFSTVYPLFVENWTAFPKPALERSCAHMAEMIVHLDQSRTQDHSVLYSILDSNTQIQNPASLMIRGAVVEYVLTTPAISDSVQNELSLIAKKLLKRDARASEDVYSSLVSTAEFQSITKRNDDVEWWGHWMGGVRSATLDDDSRFTRILLDAISSRLRDQSPPTESWYTTAKLLANSLSWRTGSPERYWLLGQFADEGVSTQRLAMFTRALALDTGAPQVNVQMILNPSSTFLERQELAQVYRKAWEDNQNDDATDSGPTKLINELRIRASITPLELDTDQAVSSLYVLARLNTAAWQFDNGLETESVESISQINESLDSSSQQMRTDLEQNRRDSQWAQEAMNAQNTSELSQLYARLIADDGPAMNSAHALVYIATLHPDPDFRSSATSQLIRYRMNTTVIIALDHIVGSSRISSRVDQLVSSFVDVELPARTDESWFSVAHNALMGQLAESLAESEGSRIKNLESEMSAMYIDRVESFGSDYTDEQVPAIQAVQLLYQSLNQRIAANAALANTDVYETQARLATRLARSHGPLHSFLAYQRGVCELHAQRVTQNVPGSSGLVQDLLDQLNTRLDQSQSVLAQIVQTERCIAQLWVLMLERGRSQ